MQRDCPLSSALHGIPDKIFGVMFQLPVQSSSMSKFHHMSQLCSIGGTDENGVMYKKFRYLVGLQRQFFESHWVGEGGSSDGWATVELKINE